jgi:hypothetical protein
MKRVADLLQSAENVIEGGPNLTHDTFQDFLEPTPIGPTGVQVMQEPPSLPFDDAFLSRAFMSMPTQAFPKNNNMVMGSHPEHNVFQTAPSPAMNPAQLMFLQQQIQQLEMQQQIQQQQMQMHQTQMQQQQHSFGFAPMNSTATLNRQVSQQDGNKPPTSGTAAQLSVAPKKSVAPSPKVPPKRTRKYQTGQWNERYQELLKFRQENGHLFVPHSFPANQKLAQWVKRQRYQYKLKHSGHHSTLSDEREDLLSSVGFIWDSHAACWQEHFQSLEAFFMTHGHCNVPSDHPDSSLSIWSKHQRRQLKRFKAGLNSTMTEERFQCLESLGFDWNPRNLKNF